MKSIMKTTFVAALAAILSASGAFAQSIFEAHRADFDYDRSLPLNAESSLIESRQHYDKHKVYFDSANGERVPAFLFVPKNIRGYIDTLDEELKAGFNKRVIELDGPPWPVVFFMHWLQSDKSLADSFAPDWTKYGYAVLAIDGIHKGERAKPGRHILEPNVKDTRWNITQQVIDCRRGVDYLESRDDIDISRLGYFGISMGAMTGAIATAVDERFKVVVLADGAGDFSVVFNKSELPEVNDVVKQIQEAGYTLEEAFEILKPVDPIEYVGHITPRPLLLINGKKDELLPYEAMEAFHKVANDPKKIVWFNSGHILPVPNVIIHTLNTFKRFMGGGSDEE